jgi:biopolymer transport protein ExbB/TolQ
MKLVMAGLLAATVAAVVVCILKLASGRLSGGSAFLAGLRVGGPLAGLLGAAYVALRMLIGLSNLESAPPLRIVAPGLAEAVLLIGLGLLAGAVATVCHWLVEARIDRAALRA